MNHAKGNPTIPARRRWITIFSWVVFCLGIFPAGMNGQQNIDLVKKFAPRVYLDCDNCDIDYIKTEITFVNYVRARQEAQVYVMITTQSTGSGGKEYLLTFQGQNEFADVNDIHKYFVPKNESSDRIRAGLVHALKLGLIRYTARTPMAEQLQVNFSSEQKVPSVHDKWRNWVFGIGGCGFFNGEQSYRSQTLYAVLSAARITENWKLLISLGNSWKKRIYQYEDKEIRSKFFTRNGKIQVVKSLTDHWSIGGYVSLYSSLYDNVKLSSTLAPAIEYNLFPYCQSSRRQLLFLYKLSFQPVRYHEQTIYGKIKENLFLEELQINLYQKEKWGYLSATLEGSHYLHDFSKNRLELYSDISLNLFKGLSCSLYAGASLIHDQLALPKTGATPEEILLKIKQLQTSYNYYISIGFNFTFGSIYTNVVNPRFKGTNQSYSLNISM